MENEFKNSKVVTRFDLGWTEDEYNDFMIDLFCKRDDIKENETVKFWHFGSNGEIIEIDKPSSKPITITLNRNNFHK